ncbi:Formin-binding protein 1-like [Dirofilaria immitis]|nr:Formin-binding protein 1-like [Dirofilaria immitis]
MASSATANWADLWDQIDILASHTQKSFSKKNLGKKKEDEESTKAYTFIGSFHSILREVESLAGQHEVIAEGLRKDIHPALSTKCVALRAARKNHLNELHIINGVLNASIDNIKTFKDAEVAHLKYDKAEKNMDLSRADLERAKNNALQRTQICEDAKQNYAHALQAANQQQHQHYNQLLPQILERLRAVDEERISETKSLMLQSIEAETKVMNIIQRCYEDMRKAAQSISPSNDSASVVEYYRSGYAHPQPFIFEDYGAPSAIITSEGTSSVDTMKRPTKNGSMMRINRKPSMGLFRGSNHSRKDGTIDFRSYPPQQRCRRLQHEIENIEKEIAKNQQSREGAAKMLQVYKDNPKLGNASDVDSEIVIYAKKYEVLNQQLAKYKAMLSEAQAELNKPISVIGLEPPMRPPPPCQSGLSSPSQSSPCQMSTPNTTISIHRSSYSEESISSDGSVPIASLQKATSPNLAKKATVVEKSEVYEECDMPALGTCIALYAFEGGSEGTMAMEEGDEMILLERDEGDGWTRVRHVSSAREGFVPTSYLQCRWYPD